MSRRRVWIASEHIGKIYGRWQVLKDAGRGNPNNGKEIVTLVLCRCLCGSNIEMIRSLSAIVKTGGSCGCLKREVSTNTLTKAAKIYRDKLRTTWLPINDYIGKTYNRLTIISIEKESHIPHKSIAKCLCECGNEKLSMIKSLVDGAIQSCGCKRFHKRSKEEIKEMMKMMREVCKTEEERALYNDYCRWKSEAEKSHIVEITFDEWKDIVLSPCYYTGLPPDQRLKIKKTINIFVHGIDRVDSDKGYTKDNCVACQAKINKMKAAQKKEDFIKFCHLVANKHEIVKFTSA